MLKARRPAVSGPALALTSLVLLPLFVTSPLHAEEQSMAVQGRVPDEYESAGGHGLGFANAGTAAVPGQASVRNNPAMLAIEKQYTLSGGYHWPSQGREYYQAGAVDSKTSPIAAGFTYTAGRDAVAGASDKSDSKPAPASNAASQLYDSPIHYRASLGVGQAFNYISVGAGVQYVQGYLVDPAGEGLVKQKGVTMGLGVAGLLTPSLRYGVSAENIANSRVAALAPTIYRAGLAYTLFNGDLTAHVDASRRQRVPQELNLRPGEEVQPGALSQDDGQFLASPENMVLASFSARIQDLVRVLGAYGHEVGGRQRRMLAGGLALINPNFSLSYMVSQPYMQDTKIHHAINLTMQVAL